VDVATSSEFAGVHGHVHHDVADHDEVRAHGWKSGILPARLPRPATAGRMNRSMATEDSPP
jgi:hypothetical protein